MAGSAIASLAVSLVARSKGFQKGLKRAARSVAQFSKTLAFAGLAAGTAVAAGFVALSRSIFNSIDRTAKLAKTLGTTTAAVQELKLAAALSGTSVDTIAAAASRVGQTLGKQLISPSKEVGEALRVLGVRAMDFAGMSPAAAFKALLPLIQKLKNPLLQNAVGAALFGRQFRDLVPLMQDSNSIFGTTNRLFNDLGLGLSGSAAKGVEDLGDAMETLTQTGGALLQKLLADMAPAITAVVIEVQKGAEELIRWAGGADNLVALIKGRLLEGLGEAVAMFRQLGTALQNALIPFRAIYAVAKALIKTVGTTGAGIAAIIGSLAGGEFAGAAGAARHLGSDLAGIGGDLVSDLSALGAEVVNEELPEQTRLLRDIRDNLPAGAVAQ